MAKEEKPVIRFTRRLNNQLMGVMIVDDRKRGRVLHGYRVVRVISAKYDTRLKQVVRIVARAYGGDPHRFSGWNGYKVLLQRRQHFTGTSGLGVLVSREVVPVDLFIRQSKQQRGQTKMSPQGRRKEATGATDSVSGVSETPVTSKVRPEASHKPTAGSKKPRKVLATTISRTPLDYEPSQPVKMSRKPLMTISKTPIDEEPDVEPGVCDNPWHTLPASSRKICGFCPTCSMRASDVPPKPPRKPLIDSKPARAAKLTKPAVEFQEDPPTRRMQWMQADKGDYPPQLINNPDAMIEPELILQLSNMLRKKAKELIKSDSGGCVYWTLSCHGKGQLMLSGMGLVPSTVLAMDALEATAVMLYAVKIGKGQWIYDTATIETFVKDLLASPPVSAASRKRKTKVPVNPLLDDFEPTEEPIDAPPGEAEPLDDYFK